jgi:hypothetical protein
MIAFRNALEFFVRFLIYSLIVILIDFVLLAFFFGGMNQIASTLSFVLLLEGGISLVAGGATVLYSPSLAKISETIFHSTPWNSKRQKELEKQMNVFIGTGIILVFEALLLSAI